MKDDILAFLIGATILSSLIATAVFAFFHFWYFAGAVFGLGLLMGAVIALYEIARVCISIGRDVLEAWSGEK